MREREVKAVLFDLDGVLIDSSYAWIRAFNDALVHFGLNPISKKEFSKIFGNPIEKDKEMFFKKQSIREIESAYNFYFKKRQNHVILFPEVISVLKKLKSKRIKIGLITNSTKEIAYGNLNHFKLKKYFDAVVTMNDVKKRKPNPEMILKACRILNVNPRNTILVGDTKNDMIAGKRAGCTTVGYKVKGDYRINRLNEILKTL